MATRKKQVTGNGERGMTPARVPVRPVVVDAAHCWLERTNPLVGVSIRTAQNIFDAARSGDTQRLHWLFNEIEAANPILFTCIERRQSAIAGFRLKVSALPSVEGDLADEQKDAVETFIAGIENFTELLEHLDTAFFRGFALAQPVWEQDGMVREVRLHNSWEFLVHDGVLYHNPECNGFSRSAVSCADAGLIGIQRRRAIDYPALSVHIRHAVSERDWGRFLERYALPKPAVTMAPNATNAQRDDYIRAARAVENGQVSVWPNGSNITDFAGGSRGTDPFGSFIDHQEKLVVLLATGGTLTSLAQADTGSLAGGAQMKVWREIVRRDAGVLSQAVMKSLVKPYLAAKFGAQPCCVEFALDFPEERSPQDAANVAATLKQAGWRVDQGELEKAVGFTLERDETPPQAPAFARAKAETPLQIAKDALQIAPKKPDGQGDPSGNPPSQKAENRPAVASEVLEAFAKDASPAAKAVEAFLKNPSKEAADKLLADLPGLIPEEPDLAAVIAEEMAKAMAEAAAESLEDETAEAAARQGEKCPECGQWLDANGVCHNCHGADQLADMGYNPDDAKMQAAQIGKGKAAIRDCLSKQVDVYDAVSRSDIGTISFIYGEPVDTAEGKAYGLAHLFEKHKGEGIVEDLAESLIRGKVREPGKTGNKVAIDWRGYQIHLAKSFSRKGKPTTDKVTWVITGFKTDKEDA